MIVLEQDSVEQVSGAGIGQIILGAVVGWAVTQVLNAAAPSVESAVSNSMAAAGAGIIAEGPMAGSGF